MTLEEYNVKQEEYENLLDTNYTSELYEEYNQFKQSYMESLLIQYENRITETDRCVCDLLYSVCYSSETGQCCTDTTCERAEEIGQQIWYEIGDYLLDMQIYKSASGDRKIIDVIFGGAYVPWWDGDEWGDEDNYWDDEN